MHVVKTKWRAPSTPNPLPAASPEFAMAIRSWCVPTPDATWRSKNPSTLPRRQQGEGGGGLKWWRKKRCQNHRRDKLTMWIAGRLSNPRWVALGEKRFLLCKRLFSTLGGYYLFRHLYISVIASGLKTEWLLAKILFSVSSFWFSLFGFH